MDGVGAHRLQAVTCCYARLVSLLLILFIFFSLSTVCTWALGLGNIFYLYWRLALSDESFFQWNRCLGAIKQYLCLSLLKNSASTLMIVFQLSFSIFISLVSRFRVGLKAEIGVFFPMIVLRVLENVAQPNYQQKMIVLRFLDNLCVDSQILVDIFLNYDCDVNSSNIFERYAVSLLLFASLRRLTFPNFFH